MNRLRAMATTDKDVETAKTTTVEERIDELRKRRKAALTPGGRDAAAKQHERGKLTARERVQLLMDKGSFVETDPFAVHRAHDFGMDRKRPPGDGVVTGYGTVGRPEGLRGIPGLRGLRRLDGRGPRAEGVQGDGPRDLHRRALRADQRLRRGADPGGRRLARRLRLHLRTQRPRERRDPADLRDHGALRRRRGLLPRDHRLHVHGEGDLAHVHHRSRRDQDGDRRGGHVRGARRRDDALGQVGRRLARSARTTRTS